MPFKSKKQESWAFANKKPWAKEWANKTNQENLPNEVLKKKGKKMKEAENKKETIAEKGVEEPGQKFGKKKSMKKDIYMSDEKKTAMKILEKKAK